LNQTPGEPRKQAKEPAAAAAPGVRALDVLRRSGAVRSGHFLLTSGKHSDTYVEKFRLLERPQLAGPLLGQLAARFQDQRVSVVLGPAVGGIIIAYEMARHLGARAVFAERADGRLTLRRGFRIEPGERCLVVEDVVTTGGSLLETLAVARAAGAEVVGAALLVDRSGGVDFAPGIRVESLTRIQAASWEAGACPLCAAGAPLEQPGSRRLQATGG